MANRWKGKFVVATAATSSGTAYTGKANGSWSLNNQIQQKQGGLWAKGQTVPNAPTSVSATAGNAQSVISFTAPADTGGSTITSYTVTSSGGQTATGSASPITVTGLTNGTAYTFTITATNTIGTSVASSPSNSITPSAGPAIGTAMAGGFYAGSISTSGNGGATHYLIVAPKATGEASGKTFGPFGVTTGFTSVINGPANSSGESALGVAYQAATFCEGLTIGGFLDWYLPALNELEVLYYFLKPTTAANATSYGSNANAVSPEPYNTNYTSSSPAQTSAGIGFRTGETNAFVSDGYWCSSEFNSDRGILQDFTTGGQYDNYKNNSYYVRAVRRVPI